MDLPEFDYEKLKKEQEDAKFNKDLYGAMGAVAQGFDNVPSSYQLLYGKGEGTGKNTKAIFDNLQKGVEDPTERQAKLYANYKAAKDAEEIANKASTDSKFVKAMSGSLIKNKGINPKDLEGLNATQISAIYGDPGKLEEIKAQSQVNFNNKLQEMKIAHGYDMEKEAAKRNAENFKKNDPNEKLKGLSSGDKARYDNALMVAKAIDEMGGALDKGENTFSMIGDNTYTAAERRAAEAFGRMQSGGAVNKEEEARFLAMLPRAKDSKEMQRSKLLTQRDEMISRLKTLGFTPQEAGYVAKDFTYGRGEEQTGQTANAGGKSVVKKQFSPSRNQTRIMYSDGSSEVVDGQR